MAEKDRSEQVKKLAQKIWVEYEPGIRKLCSRKLSSYPHEVDDVVQDVYVALHLALNDGRVIRNVRGWLYGTANNLISKKYEEIREKRDRCISLSDSYYCHKLRYEIDMLEPRISDERINQAKKEIEGQLSHDDNVLIEMLYEKKMNQRTAAKKFKVTENALKQKSYRVRRTVKRMVRDKIKEIMNEM